MDFPINKQNTITDPTFLYRSLGSFWTDIFQEKDTLKGYTRAQAEEITQRYLDLIEVINNYAAEKVTVFHKEKWLPIQILKSQINEIPFIFKNNDAVFGPQPNTSPYYAGKTFKFGNSKTPTSKVYQFFVGSSLVDFGVIADRIIDPVLTYIKGADVILDKQALVFNTNIFEEPGIPKFDVFNDDGSRTTYTDIDGNTQFEQGMILWAYNGKSDKEQIFNSFGYIFEIYRESSSLYKELLAKLVAMQVSGPTVNAMKKLFAIFAGLPYVINQEEIVEQLYDEEKYHVVVTDKEVYKIGIGFSLQKLYVGQVLAHGDYLTSNIEFFDNQTNINGWWKRNGLIIKQLAFSKNLFYGNYINQLSFSNEPDLVTLNADGDIVFPIIGATEDVTRFNKYLNSNATRKTKIKDAFGLVDPGDSYLVIPLDFVMDNFLKQNTALFKVIMPTHDKLADILSLVPLLKKSLPPYVYFVVKAETSVEQEVYTNLNGELVDIDFSSPIDALNADGSNEDGEIEKLAPFYYNDVNARLFSVTKGLLAQPYEAVTSADSSITPTDVTVISGALRGTIVAGSSTAQVNKLLFLDFS